jgi:hypothetical protein
MKADNSIDVMHKAEVQIRQEQKFARPRVVVKDIHP